MIALNVVRLDWTQSRTGFLPLTSDIHPNCDLMRRDRLWMKNMHGRFH